MEGPSSTSHFRSISLPSKLTHPSITTTETTIKELKVKIDGDLVCSSETIQSSLIGLAELYVCVDELIRSPHTQALSQHQSGTLVEDALERSIMSLDLCSVLKELIMLMKEHAQILQSGLRRKGSDLTVANQIAAYLCFRKKAKKSIIKSLGILRRVEKKMTLISFPYIDHHVSMLSKVLREVNALTISIFKTLLVFVSPKSRPTNRAQLLSKLVLKSTSTYEKKKVLVNEVETVDMVAMSLHKSAHNNETKDANVHMALRKLQILDISLDGFETGLNSLFRRLIENRASLLNIVVC